MDELIRQLQDRRAGIIARRDQLAAEARANMNYGPEDNPDAEKLAKYNAAMAAIRKINDEELKQLDAELTSMSEQRDRDRRAAELRASTGDGGPDTGRAGGSGVQVTGEPTVYGEHSGHSYFLDLCRVTLGRGDGDGGLLKARERQDRHQAELRVEMPKREALAERTATRELEHRLSGADLEGGNRRERRMARAERRALERAQSLGVPMYERRIISRTDGQGGYEVPPLWLVDEIVPYLRAGRTLADLWHNFPLPSGTDSINIPRFVVGTATGTQPGDGAPVPGRDAQDNFVQARVMTVAGQEDAAMQLLDQSPLNYDEIVLMDLAADYNMQVSAQLMLGAGFPQLNGMFQTGVLWGNGTLGTAGPTNSGHYAIANALTTNQFIGNPGSTTSMYTASGQLKSKIGRTRFLPPTAWVCNPAVWEALSTAPDGNNRPLVVPDQNGPFNAVAIAGDAAVEGAQGRYLTLPIATDPNIPLTFGGTGATQPSIGSISNGHTAPTDGSGGTSTNANVFTPLIAARWDDLFFWEGTFRTRVLTEVLSGNLAVRFQGYAYCASMPNRYQDASGNLVSYGNVNSIGALGAALSQGAAGGLVGF